MPFPQRSSSGLVTGKIEKPATLELHSDGDRDRYCGQGGGNLGSNDLDLMTDALPEGFRHNSLPAGGSARSTLTASYSES